MLDPLPVKGIALFVKILRDWFPVLQTLNLRPVIISEIRKVLNCRNPKNGTMYCCDRCNQIRWVPFTCKSRFCPSCGNLYNMQRANALAERMFDVPHRHVVFTIPDVLRHYFLENRSLLNVLFEAAAQTYKEVIAQGFTGSLTPGIICVLHTFSRSSDWNPHVHCLATEGGLTKWGAWRRRPFISYSNLSLTYQDILLKKLRRRIPDFAPIDNALRVKYPKGFNVEAAPPPKNPSLPDHPDHDLYERYFPGGGASIFTFNIKGGKKEAYAFIDGLSLFSLLANVADVKSLVIHPYDTTHAEMTKDQLESSGIYQNTIRLSIGTEHIDDIIWDLEKGFHAVEELKNTH